ncbi:MAG: exodeoxyribonuclease VII large subunit [Mycobacteriales bacterium]
MSLESSAEHPLPVRTVARAIGEWIARLGRVWVEGQVTELTRRPGMSTVFFTLRDPVAAVSLRVSCPRAVCDGVVPPLAEGVQVVVNAKPDFYLQRGALSLTAREIRPVGLGELLARLEQLKALLAAEGLFDPARKKRLPFLPGCVGLVTGRASAAQRDVVDNARRRWPAVRFTVREVAVQGATAVPSVMAAIRELDEDPDVDVIVVARGGGSVEDLLPFSNEGLIRAVAACQTPVVSAIGHETDAPLLDLVADLRASTPTDAGKRVVPDMAEEVDRVLRARRTAWRYVAGRLDREQARLDSLRGRPVFADPTQALDARAAVDHSLLERARRSVDHRLSAAVDGLAHATAQVRALSPAATLGRGYALLQRTDGQILRAAHDAHPAQELLGRLADGALTLTVTGVR